MSDSLEQLHGGKRSGPGGWQWETVEKSRGKKRRRGLGKGGSAAPSHDGRGEASLSDQRRF